MELSTEPGSDHTSQCLGPDGLARSLLAAVACAVLLTFSGSTAWATSTPGVYVPQEGKFQLRRKGFEAGSGNAERFEFGSKTPRLRPISGDWNGDGRDDVGLFDPVRKVFQIRVFSLDDHERRPVNVRFRAGSGHRLPIAGDWDGDGVTTVGYYSPRQGRFWLSKRTNTAPQGSSAGASRTDRLYRSFRFLKKNSGMLPVAGDWNGDGTDTVGLYSPVTGTFYLKNAHGPGQPDLKVRFGPRKKNGIWPIAGDWDGDNDDEIGFYNLSNRTFVAASNTSRAPEKRIRKFGPRNARVLPLAGDWDDADGSRDHRLTIEGEWRPSGGLIRSGNSSYNQRFKDNPRYQLTVKEESWVRIKLEDPSTPELTDPYLYLLNPSNWVVAEDNDRLREELPLRPNSEIEIKLFRGHYVLVAATNKPGRSGSFKITVSGPSLSSLQERAYDPPADPDRFLTFLFGPTESKETATAYYAAVDPCNARTTLADWVQLAEERNRGNQRLSESFGSPLQRDRHFRGFVVSAYRNGIDLGLGRRMYTQQFRTPNGKSNVYSFVENYPTQEHGARRVGKIATVAMEYSLPETSCASGSPVVEEQEPRFTKFFIFDANDERIGKIDLDFRGDKFVPGVCNVCHGGRPKALLGSGEYPDHGDTGALFMPWDVEQLRFPFGKPFLKRQQSEEFDFFNSAALATIPESVTGSGYGTDSHYRDLLQGWRDDGYKHVPEGWRGDEELYSKVVAPLCRACHLQRFTGTSNELTFPTEQSFKNANMAEKIRRLVFEEGKMPAARLTYESFWRQFERGDYAAGLLADRLGVDLNRTRPDLPIARVERPELPNPTTIRLNAKPSLRADSYQWTLLDWPADGAGSGLVPSTSAEGRHADRPEVELHTRLSNGLASPLLGRFRVRLVVRDGNGQSSEENLCLELGETVDDPAWARGRTLFKDHCVECHSAGSKQGRSAATIRSAIDDVPNMKSRLDLGSLGDAALGDIAAYLDNPSRVTGRSLSGCPL